MSLLIFNYMISNLGPLSPSLAHCEEGQLPCSELSHRENHTAQNQGRGTESCQHVSELGRRFSLSYHVC